MVNVKYIYGHKVIQYIIVLIKKGGVLTMI